MSLKSFIKDKSYGFYVSFGIALAFLITGIVYIALYAGTRDYNIWAAILPFIGFAVSAVMMFVKPTVKLLPYAQGILSFASLLVFVQSIYLYVSEVMTDIDYDKEMYAPFIVATVFFAITFIATLVNCYLPQVKKAKEEKLEEVAANE